MANLAIKLSNLTANHKVKH